MTAAERVENRPRDNVMKDIYRTASLARGVTAAKGSNSLRMPHTGKSRLFKQVRVLQCEHTEFREARPQTHVGGVDETDEAFGPGKKLLSTS